MAFSEACCAPRLSPAKVGVSFPTLTSLGAARWAVAVIPSSAFWEDMIQL
jgi:hypothetical protein